jgi:hypothetical protein
LATVQKYQRVEGTALTVCVHVMRNACVTR